MAIVCIEKTGNDLLFFSSYIFSFYLNILGGHTNCFLKWFLSFWYIYSLHDFVSNIGLHHWPILSPLCIFQKVVMFLVTLFKSKSNRPSEVRAVQQTAIAKSYVIGYNLKCLWLTNWHLFFWNNLHNNLSLNKSVSLNIRSSESGRFKVSILGCPTNTRVCPSIWSQDCFTNLLVIFIILLFFCNTFLSCICTKQFGV